MIRRRFLACVLPAALALPDRAFAQLVDKQADELLTGEFTWHPERAASGLLGIIVSIPDQRVYVYRNGVRIAVSTCSTGKPGHATPTGVFKILQKDKYHRSSTYSGAPMPNMNRLTWSGVALHAGKLPGYPASHGCVRLPLEFSERLYGITYLGAIVIIGDNHSQPETVLHPGMVLGEYAKHEFAAASEALDPKHEKNQLPAPDVTQASSTTVLVSTADRWIKVFDNHVLVAEGKATIAEPERPLGQHVFMLVGAHDGSQGLHWIAFGHGAAQALLPSDAGVLKRIRGDAAVMEAMKQYMHAGMTLITTDSPADATTRSADDFVVLHNGG